VNCKLIRLPQAAIMAAMTLVIGQASMAADVGAKVKQDFRHELKNVPGKSLVAVEVLYPPGGTSKPHHHAKSAFIYGYVIAGRIVNQVEGQPEENLGPGDSFYEEPGAHHVVSRNASKTAPARFLAVFVVDSDDKELTVADH
jgi:quercetin dioxygenase-like cupin family protein